MDLDELNLQSRQCADTSHERIPAACLSPESAPVVRLVAGTDVRRCWLAHLLGPAGLQLRIYGSLQDFLDSFVDTPGCLVYDAASSSAHDMQLFQQLRSLKIDLPIIVTNETQSAEPIVGDGTAVFTALRFDASKLVRNVQIAVESDVLQRENRRPPSQARDMQRLTDREREVMLLLLSGRAENEICQRLEIDVGMVKIHQSDVLRKIGLTSLDELLQRVLHKEKLNAAA